MLFRSIYDDHVGESKARHYGSVIGFGVEKMFTIFNDQKMDKNLIASLEFNMMNFNKKTSGSDYAGDEQSAVGSSQYSVEPKIKNLLFTINYKFSGNTFGLKNLIQ